MTENEMLVKLSNAIELSSEKEITTMVENGRLIYLYGTDSFDTHYQTDKIRYYQDTLTGQCYKFFPDKHRTVICDLKGRIISIEQSTLSIALNLKNLFKAIKDNESDYEINRSVTKTLHPQQQLIKFLSKTMTEQDEIKKKLLETIENAIELSLENYTTQEKISLLLEALNISQVQEKDTNSNLRFCLEKYLQFIETEGEVDIV